MQMYIQMYGIRLRTFTSKNYTYKNFDAIRIQIIKENFSIASCENVIDIKIIYLPKFTSNEKSGGYSVHSYS